MSRLFIMFRSPRKRAQPRNLDHLRKSSSICGTVRSLTREHRDDLDAVAGANIVNRRVVLLLTPSDPCP